MKQNGVSKIALMQLKAIGDTLMCEPSVAAIRTAYPQAEITFITGDVAYQILKYHPEIDKFIVWHKKSPLMVYLRFLLSLREQRYDVLIDFYKNPRSQTFARLIRAARKISFRSARRNSAYNVLLDDYCLQNYVAAEKLRLTNYILPSPAALSIPNVYFTDEHRQLAEAVYFKLGYTAADTVMIISPVAKDAKRLWKPHNYAKLCDFILKNYPVKLLFTWGPSEKHLVEEVKRLMQEPSPDTDYCIPSVHALAAIYEKAQLWVGNDSGPRHIAIGAKLPTLAAFGHFWSKYWTPPNNGLHQCVEPENTDPEFRGDRIDSISYERMEAACKEWMDRMMQRIDT